MSIEVNAYLDAGYTYDSWRDEDQKVQQRVREAYRAKAIKETVRLLSDCADTDMSMLKEIAEGLAAQHRNLVLIIMGSFILTFINRLAAAKTNGHFDLRNEAMVNLALEMKACADKTYHADVGDLD